jgi:hypothetical protein
MGRGLSKSDVASALETWNQIQAEGWDAYDGPVTIMLSIGYADVCLDGDVVAHGRVLTNVADLEQDALGCDDEPYGEE